MAATEPSIVAEIVLHELPGRGVAPKAMAFLDGRLYVANLATANVSVIEGERVIQVIPVGARPVVLWADEASGQVYVANHGADSVSVISGDSVVRTLRVRKRPSALALVGGELVVATEQDGELALLGTEIGDVRRDVMVDPRAGVLSMALDAGAGLLFVNVYNETYVVDTRSWCSLYKLALNSYVTLAASPHLGRFYVNDYDAVGNEQYLVAVDSADGTVLGRVPIGGDPRGAAVNSRRGRVYVANSWSNDLTVIQEEPYRVLETVPVGMRPEAVAVDEAADRVYVANADSDNVVVLDGETNRVVATIPLAIKPQGIVVDPHTRLAYVANPSTNSVFVLGKDEVIAELPVGFHPVALDVDPERARLYVANKADGTASVVDLDSGQVVATVAVGERPEAVAVHVGTGRVYVGDAVLDGDSGRVVARLSLRTTPLGYPIVPRAIQVDPLRNRLYLVGFNGTPGSNGGDIIYVVDGETLKLLDGRPGGLSTFDLALNVEGGRLYSVAGRFGNYDVYINDAETYAELQRRDFRKRTRSLAYNPATDHLFVGLMEGGRPDVDQSQEIRVLDGSDLQDVASLPIAGVATAMAVDRNANLVYVSDAARGIVIVVQDAPLSP